MSLPAGDAQEDTHQPDPLPKACKGIQCAAVPAQVRPGVTRGLQAMRNLDDLETMACPPKYRAMQTFWKYYSGQAKAPYPTLFGEPAALLSCRCRI